MALPNNFSPWEHLQDTWKRVHNRRVREHFSDLSGADDDWDAEIDSPRGSLRVACTMLDGDTAAMTNMRILLFWLVLGQASALHPALYTMPTDRYQQMVKFAPQVTLYFKEDLDDVEEGYAPIDAQISFRLMGEDYDSITRAELISVANKIRTEFATGSGYRWQKGRVMMSYNKLDDGYFLRIHSYSESEGRSIINKVLDIQNKTLDESFLTINTLAATPPIVPPSRTILGKSRRLPRKRPVGYVRFIYADAHVWAIPEAICLLDRSGRRKNPLVAV